MVMVVLLLSVAANQFGGGQLTGNGGTPNHLLHFSLCIPVKEQNQECPFNYITQDRVMFSDRGIDVWGPRLQYFSITP